MMLKFSFFIASSNLDFNVQTGIAKHFQRLVRTDMDDSK